MAGYTALDTLIFILVYLFLGKKQLISLRAFRRQHPAYPWWLWLVCLMFGGCVVSEDGMFMA